jgi:hypothetical protein
MEFNTARLLSMKIKPLNLLVLAATALSAATISKAWAVVDNSQPPTAAFCSGPCGVGSSIGFSRTVERAAVGDDTSFTDIYTFSLSEPGHINGIVFANNTLNDFRLIDLNTTLQPAGGGPNFDPVGGYTVPNPPPFNSELSVDVHFNNLLAGDYQFVLAGLVPSGQNAGQYEFQGVVSTVPLPAAGWLFLTAIFGLFGSSRLRRFASSSA